MEGGDGAAALSTRPPILGSPTIEKLALVGAGAVAFLPYLVINRVTASWPAYDLSTPLDRITPFNPNWELIYASIYVFAILPAIYIRDVGYLRRIFVGFVLSLATSYVFFLGLPVGIERPEGAIDPERAFLEWGVALNYVLDQPRNLFPSLHVANAYLTSLVIRKVDRPAGNLAFALATAIAASTMIVKQHLLADVLAGFALGAGAYALIVRPYPTVGRPRAELCHARWTLLIMPVVYAAIIFGFYVAWRSGWRPFSWPPR